MKNVARGLAASGLILGISLVAAAPAMAVTWGSRTAPVVGYDGRAKFGKMYGNFYNDASVSAMSTTWEADLQPGGSKVRVETDFLFHEWSSDCGNGGGTVCWVQDVSKQTVETNSPDWVKDSRARNLHAAADGARGGINICEILKWHNDPCSAHAYPTFSY